MELSQVLTKLLAELVDGARDQAAAFILNSGDAGLLRSLHKLSAADASCSVNDGATIAAHAQHVRYGLSLMINGRVKAAIPSQTRNGTKRGRRPSSTPRSGSRSRTDCATRRIAGLRHCALRARRQ